MKINISVPNAMHVPAMTQPWQYDLTGAEIADIISIADSLDFHRAMMGEHFIVPQEHIAMSGAHYFNTPVGLAFLAGHTKKMKLSSSISILPLQNPLAQAKAWSTLDFLSGGRAEPIFGMGWLKEEFDMMGVDFHKRGAMADEYMSAMKLLWSEEVASFEGKYVSFKDVGFAPKPVQKPHMPVWFGGDAPAAQRRVARFGDGWMPFRTPPEKIPDCLDYIRSQPDYHGRPLTLFFSVEQLGVGAQHEVIDDDRAAGVWDAQKVIDQCKWLEELGVNETTLPVPPMDGIGPYKEWLQWVSEEVMPKV